MAETGGRGLIARAREIAKTASIRKNDVDRKASKDSNTTTTTTVPTQRRNSLGGGSGGGGLSNPTSYANPFSTSRSRHGPPSRHISSDNLGPYATGSRSEELGTATLHGNADVSRVRSKKTTETDAAKVAKSTGTKGDRRSQMKRAMSRENVKPPEEYGPNSASNVTSVTTNKYTAYGLYGNSPEPRRGRRKPAQQQSDNKEDRISMEKHIDHSEIVSESEDSFAEDDDHEIVEHRPHQTNLQRKKSTIQPPRRDLLGLLRDQKTVQLSDMKDRDNRRILHFLMYQHTLNIDLSELQSTVDHDIAVNGAAALRRPVLPLYVEPAN
jgi:hypothetical protein